MKRILITGGSGFIGTHLVNHLLSISNDWQILNLDINKPLLFAHFTYWKQVDILNKKDIEGVIINFDPEFVVHLAANASVEFKNLSDYNVNTVGTSNLLHALKKVNSLKHAIITSTQAVCMPNYIPKYDDDYKPNTIYGDSKALMEQLVRETNLNCSCTIIRPTYIWGPYHPKNSSDLFLSIRKRYYCYPGKTPILRSYGYVKNVVWQIEKLLHHNFKDINVFYVGDMPINYFDWVNIFSIELTKKNIRTIPLLVLKLMSLTGDFISKLTKKPFLINSYRYVNMTQENITPMQKTFELLGPPPFSLENGVCDTVKWLYETWEFNEKN